MRILEAITPSTVGGAEVCAIDLHQSLTSLGVEVDVFCPKGRTFIEYAARRGVQCVSWDTHGKIDPLTVTRLRDLMRSNHTDVIHTHLSTASFLGALAARLAGVKSVAHVHGLNSTTWLRLSDTVIAVSEAVKAHLSLKGFDENRIAVVHNGVDLAKFRSVEMSYARRVFEYDSDVPVIGVFGRLSPEKGQAVAIRAMRIITQRHPEARLIIAGRGGDEDALKGHAVEQGIAANVDFPGFMQDVKPLMSACDIVIVPSLKEGFGMSAVEAMALGKPVVASNTGGLNEIVVDRQTGVLSPAGDFKTLGETVSDMLDDLAASQRMGVRGRERAEDCFDLCKQSAKLLQVLER